MTVPTPFVAVLMGSDSDFPVMKSTLEVLDAFGVGYEVRISSAHRTPAATRDYVLDAQSRGCAVFIAAAGMAAHLAGAVASLTIRPEGFPSPLSRSARRERRTRAISPCRFWGSPTRRSHPI